MTGEQKGGTVVKIYNKKGWVLGMGEILLGIVGVCIYVQTGFQTFDWKVGTLLILLFSFGVSGIVRSCSKEASREDRITQRDERNQYIALRCRAKTMEIMTYFLFAMVAGCMIGYGITKDTAFLWLLIGAGIPFGVLQIVSIVLGLYYERNQ